MTLRGKEIRAEPAIVHGDGSHPSAAREHRVADAQVVRILEQDFVARVHQEFRENAKRGLRRMDQNDLLARRAYAASTRERLRMTTTAIRASPSISASKSVL